MTDNSMTMQDLGEFGFIEWEAKRLKQRDSSLLVGIGDDAAVLQTDPSKRLVATTDMLVEDVHFRLDWTDPWRLGWKTVAVNLSDLAAMGAIPGSVLISLGISTECTVSFLDSLYDGMEEACKRYGATIAGGDTVSSPKGLVLNIAAFGTVEKEKIALRSGAKTGDAILVTGTLGDSAAGLSLLMAGYKVTAPPMRIQNGLEWLLERHLAPIPRLAEARAAVETGKIHAMMDISDGLAGDIRHICEQSGVGVEIEEIRIPISAELQEASAICKADPSDWALSGGEDYELLMTCPEESIQEIADSIGKSTGTKVSRIGRICEDGFFLKSPSGTTELRKKGYTHF